MKVVQLVRVPCGISSGGVHRRRLNEADRGPFGDFFGCDVGPVLAAVPGKLNKAVVGSRPQDTFLFRRLGESEDNIIIFDAVLVLGDWPPGILLLGFVVASEVGADFLPTMA